MKWGNRFLKIGFFKQLRELKIQRKIPGCALRIGNVPSNTCDAPSQSR